MTTPPEPAQPLSPSANPAPAAQSQPEMVPREDMIAAIERARAEEKTKLYGKIDETSNLVKSMQDELATVRSTAEQLAADREKARQEAEAAARAEADKDKSAKELLEESNEQWRQRFEQQNTQWNQRFEQQESERAMDRALLDKERELNELSSWRNSRVQQEIDAERIPVQLARFVTGTSQEEIEQSIITVQQTAASILEEIAQAQSGSRAAMPGVSVAAGNIGPLDAPPGGTQKRYTPEEIAALPPGSPEHMALRKANGIDRAGQRGVGILG